MMKKTPLFFLLALFSATCANLTPSAHLEERPRPDEWKQFLVWSRFIDRFIAMPKDTLSRVPLCAGILLPLFVVSGIVHRVPS